MYETKIDIAVLLIFFCRDEQFGKVFAEVKKARPSRLYLYQDGARVDRQDDIEGIEKCRAICSDEQIDWECEVHRFYQEQNKGCDPSGYIAQKWMFETEEMGIVLEDDVVPSQSFFSYCKELLEKYKDDTRVHMICGMNHLGSLRELKESYFFSKVACIWGWASWKRVVDTWDSKYTWLDDKEKLDIIRSQMPHGKYKNYIKTAKWHKSTGKEYHETINGPSMYLYNRLSIVPKYNMISNIGVAKESTHSVSDIRLLPNQTQKLFYMKTHEIEFPLIHPTEIKRNKKYEQKIETNAFQSFFWKIEHLLRVWRYQGFKAFLKKFKRKKK